MTDKAPAQFNYPFAFFRQRAIRDYRGFIFHLCLFLCAFTFTYFFGSYSFFFPVLLIIFIILYLQFKSVATTGLVFSGIAVAWAGGFIMIWLYAQPWFLDMNVFGMSLREMFQVHSINLSVAIWVGFLALFGIATDDGVVVATYLKDSFAKHRPDNIPDIRKATLEAGKRRIRPCLMTTATTILALLPVLTSTGRGSDIMVPMAIPSFGGMAIEVITMLVVPVLYCSVQEWKLKAAVADEKAEAKEAASG